MKIAYQDKRFNRTSLLVLEQAESIIDEYQRGGFDLTLRQLYYQFIARNAFPDEWLVRLKGGQQTKNHERNYKKLGELISNGRLAGVIDWDAIVDRTRTPLEWQHEDSPREAIQRLRQHYSLDKWANQPLRVEVWVEKEALSGVFRRICGQMDVPLFACRGYVSQSAQWQAHQRFLEYAERGQRTVILHFGDHDPSGIDMTRDVLDRLSMFNAHMGYADTLQVERLALNIDQVRKFNPPPSPAKLTDPRADGYIKEFGEDSWELDALDPDKLTLLAENAIQSHIDVDRWSERLGQQQEDLATLWKIIQNLKR